MASIQSDKIQSRAASTGYAASASRKRASSEPRQLPDFFDDKGSVIGSEKTPITPTVKPSKSAFTRKWLKRGIVGTVGAGLLAFAGYGMFAAGPHIAAGITAAFAVPAVHFIAIGVGVGLAIGVVALGVYLGVKAFNKWKNGPAHTPNVLTKAPPALDSHFNDETGSVDDGEDDRLSHFADEIAQHIQAQGTSAALERPEGKRAAKPAAQPTTAPAFVDVDDGSTEVATPAANFRNLPNALGDSAKEYQDFYAKEVLKYRKAPLANRISAFTKLQEYEAVFPELKDRTTFEAALPELEPVAKAWLSKN